MKVKKTFPKILWLIFSSSIFFILLYFALFYYTKKAEKQVYNSSIKQFDNEIQELMHLINKPELVYINNDTNWDEFVNFIKKRDLAWYNDIIAHEIDIYKADQMVVYDENNQLVIHTKTSKIKSEGFIPKEAMDKLDESGLDVFYMKIPEGYIEVFGASVHPSFDLLKNKTKSSGYFFVIRLIDQSYISNIEGIANSKVFLTKTLDVKSNQRNKINSFYSLKNFDGKLIGRMRFERNFAEYFENAINILYVIIVAFVINLIVNLIYTRRLVYHPLYLVRRALETGNRRAIKQLKKSTGEFSYIGNLFEENSNQKIELIKAKIKAEESDRLKSSFLANLSHEIRTPMNAINGFTELILNTKISESEKLEYLNVIEKSGKNLVGIIDDLIEMSKIESNQLSPNLNVINLDSMVTELYETVKVTIQNKDVDIKLEKSKTPAKFNIVTDDIKLKQVIINLLTNAIKFTEKGSVTFGFEIDEENELINFTVKDTGLGISEANHKDIFDRFKRVDSDISIKVGGLGLGLAISKAYIDLLGGTISLESKVGEGSTFYFSIPLRYSKIEHITVKSINNLETIKDTEETILIAEDDNINFLLFQKMMQHKNYKIIRALNGQEAVDICLNEPNIELVLMDIKMPIMNGFEALEQIRPMRPNLPIIAQTAYSSSDDKIRIEEAGFNGYITKPLNRDNLFELINKYLDKENKNES
ncbi:MAG: ATP-binding protein [Flavobacterium sp. JAD_PAG50586_2]|nr:MAG: ATP-binding protein [Flavobacterium sp. JAD_PAG50586_2]